ncbi:MAG: RNA-binding S4 domain-containing protein [Bacillota bacterium]
MRLDKFLKVSRIIKRRTVAKDACAGGRVNVNGGPAKAGRQVSVGDHIEIAFGNRVLEVEVTQLKSHVSAGRASDLYRVVREEYSDKR